MILIKTSRRRGLFASACVIGCFSLGDIALAGEIDGDIANPNPISCGSNPVASIVKVCNTVKKVFTSITCPSDKNSCVKPKREIFTGLTVEGATPTNIKAWNGQGGGGEVFQLAGVCLMRDLAFTPMTSHAEATIQVGPISAQVSADGLVSYKSFDKTNLAQVRFEGFHSLRAHAPIIGDIDIFTQPFSLQTVSQPLKGQGLKVGGYDVYGAQALELEAVGGAQSFDFALDAIKIVTPYGTISPQPHVGFAQVLGWSMSPYGGASTMLLNPGAYQVTDVYGRLGGQKVASGLNVVKTTSGPGGPGCIPIQIKPGAICPNPVGWDSQVLLGSRNVNFDTSMAVNTPWTAPPGVAFPDRPDAQPQRARGDAEKTPGGAASAGIKIEYTPPIPLPEIPAPVALTAKLGVFVDPNIGVFYGSQYNLWNAQVGTWLPGVVPFNAPNKGTPVDVQSLQSMAIYAASTVYGRFALDAGVDIVFHVHITLPKVCNPFDSDECWPDDIDFNIVDLHPRTAFLESKAGDTQPAKQAAFVLADWQNFVKTKKLFRFFTPLNGTPTDGVAYIAQCLKQDAPPAKGPPEKPYVAGKPQDLVEVIEMPCNVCLGMPDISYQYPLEWDPVTHHVTKSETRTQKGFAFKQAPAVTDGLKSGDPWECGGSVSQIAITEVPPSQLKVPPSQVKNVGCYDQCRVNKATNTFTVTASAKTLWTQGKFTGKALPPNGCH